jgi:hypothetical protein
MRGFGKLALGSVGLFMLAGFGPLAAQSREPFPGLDAYITKAVQTWKIPGVSVAIVRNDSVIYAKGFGVLAVNSQTPVNERTLFEIGSSSRRYRDARRDAGERRQDALGRPVDHVPARLPAVRRNANGAVTLRDAHASQWHRAASWCGSALGWSRRGLASRAIHQAESPFDQSTHIRT